MGGDLAPVETVKGAITAATELGIDIALVGPRELLEAELKKYPANRLVSIVQAAEAIADVEDMARAVRQKRDASINVAMAMVRDSGAQAAVSAGNTGAVMASAFF